MALGSNLAGVARVAFEAQTEKFYAELKTVEARYEATLARMNAMSAKAATGPTLAQAPSAVMGGSGGGGTGGGVTAPVSAPRELSQTESARRLRAQRAQQRAGSFAPGAGMGQAASGMDKYTKSTQAATDATKGLGTAAGGSQKSMAGMTGGILKSSLAFAGIVGGIAVMKSLASGMAEAERVTQATRQVIESTGGVAGVTAEHVDELSAAYQRNSLFTDEQVQSGANMLLTFKNIRNAAGENNDIFDQTTAALVDMGAMFNKQTGGTDGLARASIQLGRAMNNPIAGAKALKRVGVEFTEQQEQQIKTLQENGDMMGAQKIILAELGSEFGGQAKSATETFTGSLIVMKHGLEESAESFLTGLAPAMMIFVRVLQAAIAIISPFKPIIVALTAAWVLWKVQILLTNSALFKSVIGIARTTIAMVAQKGVMGTLKVAWLQLNAVMTANPIGVIIVALALLAGAFVMLWKRSETFRDIVTAVLQTVAKGAVIWIGLIVKYMNIWLGAISTVLGALGKLIPGADAAAKKIDQFRDASADLIKNLEKMTSKKWEINVGVNQTVTTKGADGTALPPGTTGAGGAGGLTSGSVFDLPQKFVTREKIAQRRGDDAALRRVYEEEAAWIRRKLRWENLTLKERADLNDSLKGVNDNIATLDSQEAQIETDRATAAKERDQAAATARAESFKTPERILAGQAAAARTEKNLKDDAKWYRAELRFLKNKRKMLDLTYAEMKELDEAIASVEDKIDGLRDERERRRQERAERDQLLIENAMARAELTPKISDDLAVLNREEKAVRRRLAILKKKVKLSNDELAEQTALFQRLKAIRDAKKQLREDDAADETKTTKEAFEKMAFQFLTGLHGIGNQFGSNLQGDASGFGQLETHAVAQTALLRQQNQLIADLTKSNAHPYTKYNRNALTAATTGVGF